MLKGIKVSRVFLDYIMERMMLLRITSRIWTQVY